VRLRLPTAWCPPPSPPQLAERCDSYPSRGCRIRPRRRGRRALPPGVRRRRAGMQADQAVSASTYVVPSRALTAGSRRESATRAPHAREVAILLRPGARDGPPAPAAGARFPRRGPTAVVPCGGPRGRARRVRCGRGATAACGCVRGGGVHGRMSEGMRETAAALFVLRDCSILSRSLIAGVCGWGWGSLLWTVLPPLPTPRNLWSAAARKRIT
jgi:hypothetical protein